MNTIHLLTEPTSEMVSVVGGTLPESSGLGTQTVASFQIGKYEVTWGEWKEVRGWAVKNGYNDLSGIGAGSADLNPVQSVSWYDVVKWCNARSEKEGLTPVYSFNGTIYRTGEFGYNGSQVLSVKTDSNGYRLPKESEWEWAARGGIKSQGYKYSGSNEVNAVAWFGENSENRVKAIGSKLANELGIYDMSGNVYEWCWDLRGESSRCFRGGSWDESLIYCEISYRGGSSPTYRPDESIGFRVVSSSQN